MKHLLLILALLFTAPAIAAVPIQTQIPILEQIGPIATYQYSCTTPNIIHFVANLDEADKRTAMVIDLLVENRLCYSSEIPVVSQVKNMLGKFQINGTVYYMLEVYGPEDRMHFIVIEDRK